MLQFDIQNPKKFKLKSDACIALLRSERIRQKYFLMELGDLHHAWGEYTSTLDGCMNYAREVSSAIQDEDINVLSYGGMEYQPDFDLKTNWESTLWLDFWELHPPVPAPPKDEILFKPPYLLESPFHAASKPPSNEENQLNLQAFSQALKR